MSTKIKNNLKVHGENTTQKYTDAQYNTDTQRINGAQPGTPISSKLMNTGLRNATLVTSALIEALKTVVPNNNDLTTAITVGTATTHAALVTALTEALVKIKVEHATTADNVISGAIVEETTTARESKQGYGISLGLNSKLQFKTTWLGTHKNNDILYYGTAGTLKGFYIVKGLSTETKEQAAGTLTITSGQTPTTHAANLQRLTFETAIGTNTGLSKTDTVSSSSTTNQLATAKGVYDYTQAKLAKHTTAGIKILTRGTTDGILSDLDKTTVVSSTATDSQIPSAKAVFDVVNTKVDKVANYGLSKNDFTDELKNKLTGIATGAQVNPYSKTELDNKFAAKQSVESGKGLSTNDLTNDLLAKLNAAVQTDEKNTFTQVQTFSKLPVLSTDDPSANNPMSKSKADTAYFKRDVASSAQSSIVPITSSTTLYAQVSARNMYTAIITIGSGGSNNLSTSESFSTTFHGISFSNPADYNTGEVTLFGVFSNGSSFTARLYSTASGFGVSDLRFTGAHSHTHFKFAIHRIS